MPGFRPREAQQEMAEAIETVINDGGVFVAESGTGTGKTFAYLVPALMSGKRVIISTGTRHLQDQLFHRDVPAVTRALGSDATVSLLKGRSNYVCLQRLDTRAVAMAARDETIAEEVTIVSEWAENTSSGEIAELGVIGEESKIWPLVTSSPDNCLGSGCEFFKECFVVKARKEALEADILVINHHLFFADLMLREDGFGQLLPGAEAVIFDEAHQLPDIATNFLGLALTSAQFRSLGDEINEENIAQGSPVSGLRTEVEALDTAIKKLRLAMGTRNQRGPLTELENNPKWHSALEDVVVNLDALTETLDTVGDMSEVFGQCLERAGEIRERLAEITERERDTHVRWYDASLRGFRLQSAPLDIGSELGKHFANESMGWVFTSATLAVGDSFDHFAGLMGLPVFESARWDSPFAFEKNALLYLPEGMPDPRSDMYDEALIEAVVPVLESSRGRAFVLFTSYRAMHAAHKVLAKRLKYELLVQGNAPRNELLERFRSGTDVVLLGTSSFWEGVDVRGEALSCVIIDKLPFESVQDPLVRARMTHVESTGKNPFMHYQVPRAVMTLKQGAGRLIRDEDDRGVLMICDPRLTSKGYGRQFLKNLPPMPVVRDIDRVRSHFELEASGA